MKSMRVACSREGLLRIITGTAAIALTCQITLGAPRDTSDIAGVHRVTLVAGPNFIAAPLHRPPSFRGPLDSATSATVTMAGSPGWAVNKFAPRDGHAQFVAMLTKDASASPGNVGDWWPIAGNSATSITLETGGEDLTTILAKGDELEIRPLTSLKDLFGTGSSLRLNKDADGSANPGDEDVIYLVGGTSFSSEILYHDGSVVAAGYYMDGNGPFDGSTLTIAPDEAIMVFRKSGSPAYSYFSSGHAQVTPLTHYLQPGANSIGTGFAVDLPMSVSGLQESGWKADSDGGANTTDEDVLYTVNGSSFSDEVFLHDGSVADAGWYANGVQNDAFPLASLGGLVVFVQNPLGLRWRAPVPF